ncbi:MAG: pyruvate dehydrogenase component, partial [Pseudomonadota bacterium]|nr:pyruvate dehydrogenase component [Pseudomonadota bacterium]
VCSSDLMRNYAEQVRKWVPGRYVVLGTDGFGRSDTREQLRKHFEVNRYHIVVAALKALSDDGQYPAGKVQEAIEKYGLNPEKPNPMFV